MDYGATVEEGGRSLASASHVHYQAHREGPDGAPEAHAEAPRPASWSRRVLVVCCAGMAVVVGFNSSIKRAGSASSLEALGMKLGRSSAAHFAPATDGSYASELSLSIGSKYGVPRSLKHFPESWSKFVEPHRPTNLTILGLDDADDPVSWTLAYTPKPTEMNAKANRGEVTLLKRTAGTSIQATFPIAGQWYSLTAVTSRRTFNTKLLCRYVRREMRALHDDDRSRYLDALEKIHRLSMAEGVAQYGQQFVNYEKMTGMHMDQMTLDGCTIYHNTDVFFGAHSAFTLMLEQALQAIDPTIAAPYWDYTIDDATYGNEWAAKSPLFRDDWFGSASPDNAADPHVIERGRFSYIPISGNSTGPEHNGYRMQTESWNANPSAYVQRSSSICGLETRSRLPGCKEMLGVLAATNELDMHANMEFLFHARVHMMTGGAWDCPFSLLEAVEAHRDNAYWARILESLAVSFNTLWRSSLNWGLLKCDRDCAAGAPSAECSCSCPEVDEHLAAGTLDSEKLYHFLNTTSMWDMMHASCDWCIAANTTLAGEREVTTYSFANLTAAENDELMYHVLMLACHPGKVSQMGTPLAGPNDPLFWPVHGAFERVVDYLRLIDNTTICDDAGCSLKRYDWSYGEEDDDATGCSQLAGPAAGHVGTSWLDVLPFEAFLGDATGKQYSNQQLWQLFDPMNPRLTYVYDDFDWAVCSSGAD